MKFKTYLAEDKSGSLIGKTIKGKKITEKTKNEQWKGNFDCGDNQLTSLVGAPTSVGGDFYCYGNKLTSLIGAPTSVGRNFNCVNNQLTSLRGIHKEIKQAENFYCPGTPIKEAVLGLLLIKGLTKVKGLPCDDIINRYLPNTTGMEGVSRCQDELEEAGLDEFAEL